MLGLIGKERDWILKELWELVLGRSWKYIYEIDFLGWIFEEIWMYRKGLLNLGNLLGNEI